MSRIVALSRPYTCVFGAPVLTSVDPRIFALRYFTHCMACGFCADQCCSYGVDIDTDNAKRVVALLGICEADHFTDTPTPDGEFPSGSYVRTKVKDGKCIFHIAGGRGCSIHAYCAQNGLDYHLYKPMVSTLFPVTFENGLLCASSEAMDGSLICSGEGPSLYEGAREELAYYFGADFVAEVDAMKVAVA